MVQAYQVPDANKVHGHETPLQGSPSRLINAAVIGGRTARGVVGTPTPGNGGQGRTHAQERLVLTCLLHIR